MSAWGHVQPRSRPVIGMVTSGPLLEMCGEQWLGVSDAAQANDCDLFCFVGRKLHHRDPHLRQTNAIFDLISADRVDALIIWTIRFGLPDNDADLERFVARFAPLPIVTVEQQVGNWPTVLMDNRRGMERVVSHMIEVHGHRRIAFVRGPDSHSGAQDRYAGYLDALTRHGLPVDPDLVIPREMTGSRAAWGWDAEAAADAVRTILKHVTVPPESIAAANDDFAVSILGALDIAGIRAPTDMGVIGYDNLTNIRMLGITGATGPLTPPLDDDPVDVAMHRVNANIGTLGLTTVRAPFDVMGRHAVELALAQVRGQPVPPVTTIPTELVIRRSCGCFPAADEGAAPPGRNTITLQPSTKPKPD